MPALPTGTVTFLFTDVEGSTRLLEEDPAAYRDAVRRHHALLRGVVEAHGGVVFETVGAAGYAAFGAGRGVMARRGGAAGADEAVAGFSRVPRRA
jgi:class 3 adenylate cyclase